MQKPAIFAASDQPSNQCPETVDSLLRMGHALRSLISTEMTELDLNEIRHAVLCFLLKRSNGCSQRELADELGQTESSISTLLRRMQSDQLIQKTQSPTDARQRLLSLTERGEQLAVRAAARFRQFSNRLMRDFDIEQHAAFDHAVELICRGMIRMTNSAPASEPSLTLARPPQAEQTQTQPAASSTLSSATEDNVSTPMPPAASENSSDEIVRRAA